MAFVQVEDTRIDAQCAQRTNTADAEHDLLPQPAIRFRHVEAVGDVAEVVGVRFEVGVQEEQRHPADLGPPDRDADVARADRRLDLDPFDLAHGQLGAAVLEVDLELPAAAIDVLPPKALPVQETHRDQRKP